MWGVYFDGGVGVGGGWKRDGEETRRRFDVIEKCGGERVCGGR